MARSKIKPPVSSDDILEPKVTTRKRLTLRQFFLYSFGVCGACFVITALLPTQPKPESLPTAAALPTEAAVVATSTATLRIMTLSSDELTTVGGTWTAFAVTIRADTPAPMTASAIAQAAFGTAQVQADQAEQAQLVAETSMAVPITETPNASRTAELATGAAVMTKFFATQTQESVAAGGTATASYLRDMILATRVSAGLTQTAVAQPSPTKTEMFFPTALPAKAALQANYAQLPDLVSIEMMSMGTGYVYVEATNRNGANRRALADAMLQLALNETGDAFLEFGTIFRDSKSCEDWVFDTVKDDWRITPLTCPK